MSEGRKRERGRGGNEKGEDGKGEERGGEVNGGGGMEEREGGRDDRKGKGKACWREGGKEWEREERVGMEDG